MDRIGIANNHTFLDNQLLSKKRRVQNWKYICIMSKYSYILKYASNNIKCYYHMYILIGRVDSLFVSHITISPVAIIQLITVSAINPGDMNSDPASAPLILTYNWQNTLWLLSFVFQQSSRNFMMEIGNLASCLWRMVCEVLVRERQDGWLSELPSHYKSIHGK